MNDIKQFKSILKQGISRNTDVLLGCEFLEKLLNIINDYENTKNQLQQKDNIIKEVRNWINSTIDIIKQQPTGNDEWILERLNSFISLLDKAGNSKVVLKENK